MTNIQMERYAYSCIRNLILTKYHTSKYTYIFSAISVKILMTFEQK